MTNKFKQAFGVGFDDLQDDLGGDTGIDREEEIEKAVRSAAEMTGEHKVAPNPFKDNDKPYLEVCENCEGTGNFRSYTGRIVGKCFACDGIGKKAFKTSKAARTKAKENRKAKLQAAIAKFMEQDADVYEWMLHNCNNNDFAASLLGQLTKKGDLSDKQVAAVRRNIEKDEQRAKERAERNAQAMQNAATVNIDKIVAAFDKAQRNDVDKPILRLSVKV